MFEKRITVIGAGPAGCAAAVQCARLGMVPLLLDKTGTAGGLVANAFSMENYPGLEPISGPEFVQKLEAHLARFGVPVTRARVDRIARSANGFRLTGEFGALEADAVIVAVGTVSKTLEIPGASTLAGAGVYNEVRQQLDQLRQDRTSGRDVLVIGGGEAALDYSLSLARAGARPVIIVRGAKLRAVGRLVKLVEEHPAIQCMYDTTPLSVGREGDEIVLTARRRGDQRSELRGAGVTVAIGRYRAADDLLDSLDIDLNKGVSTRIPGMYIAGDARFGGLGQVGMAVGDGLFAAMAACRYLNAED